MEADVEVMVKEGRASIDADASSGPAIVTCKRARVSGADTVNDARGCRTSSNAGENPRAEGAYHAEDFVVAPSRFKHRLDDKVRRLVKGIVGLVVVQTTQIA